MLLLITVIGQCMGRDNTGAAAFPFSGALSTGLRAAEDMCYTMTVSLVSTIAGRLVLSWILGVAFGMGVIGIARAILFIFRVRSGKWKEFDVI